MRNLFSSITLEYTSRLSLCEKVVAEIKANKTIILISHRKNTLASCDYIYLLNDKKISLISKDQLTDVEYSK